jgi:hypothetical protein
LTSLHGLCLKALVTARPLALLVVVCLLGCDALGRQQRATPSLAVAAQRDRAGDELAALRGRVTFERAELRARLARSLARPPQRAKTPCPDDELSRLALDAPQKKLVLGVEDARLEQKHLLPLDILEQLVSPELGRLELSPFGDSAELPQSTSAARAELERLAQFERRRFRGIYQIVDYAKPKRIRRVDRLRPEWLPGWVIAWLVVYDADEGRPLCQTQLMARNDVAEAPLSKRLESAVRDRLVRELGAELRAATPAALSGISRELLVERR